MSGKTETPRIDFAGGAVGYRFRRGAERGHPLVKAAGIKKDRIPKIVDATAGLGRDAFLLASAGAAITLIERSPQMHALLQDALAHAAGSPELGDVIARMTLICGDARDHLPELRPDVVIVDPMHPQRRNTALVKKEMRQLSAIVGPDEDADELMRVALASAQERVVLKWPLRAKPLIDAPKPSHRFDGKTVRYEVFMTALKAQVK